MQVTCARLCRSDAKPTLELSTIGGVHPHGEKKPDVAASPLLPGQAVQSPAPPRKLIVPGDRGMKICAPEC
jgi:hypothetical protein